MRGREGRRSAGREARAGTLLVGALAASRLAAPAAAQEPPPLVTDRPDQTESAIAVPGGSLQLELGWTHAGDEAAGTRQRSHAVPATLVRIGLGAGVEARLGFSGWISERERREDGAPAATTEGAGDAEVGLKWVLSEEGATGVALLGSLSLPVGADRLSSGRVDPALRLAVGRDLGDRASVGANVGIARETAEDDGESPGSRTDALYTAALGLGITDRLGAFVESFGFFGLEGVRPDRHLVDGGLTWLVLPSLQLDASAGLGLSEAADDWFVGAGASLRLPR